MADSTPALAGLEGADLQGAELKEFRRMARAARRGVHGARRAGAEQALTSHVLSIPRVVRAGVVSVYNADDGEPVTAGIIDGLRSAGCAVALPILRHGEMRFRVWAEHGQLVEGDFGLLEPKNGTDILARDLGASLTPLVAFDRACNRIGRGAGFYDRTFGSVVTEAGPPSPSRPLLVGVAFEVQRAGTVPVREHDVPMDVIVTEHGIRHRPLGDHLVRVVE